MRYPQATIPANGSVLPRARRAYETPVRKGRTQASLPRCCPVDRPTAMRCGWTGGIDRTGDWTAHRALVGDRIETSIWELVKWGSKRARGMSGRLVVLTPTPEEPRKIINRGYDYGERMWCADPSLYPLSPSRAIMLSVDD